MNGKGIVRYSGEEAGHFVADMLVKESVLDELKSVRALHEAHEVQLVNYLNATGIEARRKVRCLPSATSRVSRPPP